MLCDNAIRIVQTPTPPSSVSSGNEGFLSKLDFPSVYLKNTILPPSPPSSHHHLPLSPKSSTVKASPPPCQPSDILNFNPLTCISVTDKMTPLPAPSHKLIPINLQPPSPLMLTTARPYYNFDDYLSSSEEEEEEADDDFDHDDDVPTMALDSQVVDQYKPLPLLEIDPTLPTHLQSTPVHESVEELLATSYPHLLANSMQYEWHLNRLKRNREYANNCKLSMERQQSRSLPAPSPSGWGASGDCKRFRARR